MLLRAHCQGGVRLRPSALRRGLHHARSAVQHRRLMTQGPDVLPGGPTAAAAAAAPSSSAAGGGGSSVFDLASRLPPHGTPESDAFHHIFDVTTGTAPCVVGPELAEKYKVAVDNRQTVVCVTNRVTLCQASGDEGPKAGGR